MKIETRKFNMIGKIEKELPEFTKACRQGSKAILIHQDAFAADYQTHEFTRIGMAVKYAGMYGREVRFVGKNLEHPDLDGQSEALTKRINAGGPVSTVREDEDNIEKVSA